jgi:hypothetical protein
MPKLSVSAEYPEQPARRPYESRCWKYWSSGSKLAMRSPVCDAGTLVLVVGGNLVCRSIACMLVWVEMI